MYTANIQVKYIKHFTFTFIFVPYANIQEAHVFKCAHINPPVEALYRGLNC